MRPNGCFKDDCEYLKRGVFCTHPDKTCDCCPYLAEARRKEAEEEDQQQLGYTYHMGMI
jgi:hypothetical protein